MSVAHQAPAVVAGTGAARQSGWLATNIGLLAAMAVLLLILALPTPEGVPVAGHRMLAILAFAVIVWMTEALDYAVSALVIAALMAFLLGILPNPANPKALMGTGAALGLAFSGFANRALALVAAALFLAAAMNATGLDRRIALVVLSCVGTATRRVIAGLMLVEIVLTFLVIGTRHDTRAVVEASATYWPWLGYA
jgi:sodium-dependent dicarboxylate transporter 2/3/5